MTPVVSFAGRKVALFGLGGSGFATAEALKAGGADVSVWDDSTAARERSAAAGHDVVDLETADWSRFTALILSPGVPLTHPEPHWTVRFARTAGIEVIGDIELFCRERARRAPRSPFFAITGTNGKSTTTALLAHLLRFFGQAVEMGGNIGTPILALEPPADDRCHVIELSTFQIDLTPSLHPNVGILLNLTPDHLDRHGTMQNYAAIKERLVARSDRAVVAVDDPFCAAIADRLTAQGRPVTRIMTLDGARLPSFRTKRSEDPESGSLDGPAGGTPVPGPALPSRNEGNTTTLTDGLVLEGTYLVQHTGGRSSQVLADLAGLPNLRGRHNAQNAAAAVAALGPSLLPLAGEGGLAKQGRMRGDTAQIERPLISHGSAVLPSPAERKKAVPPPNGTVINAGGREETLREALRWFTGLPHRMELVAQRDRVLFVNDSKATNADAAEQSLRAFRDIHWIVGGVAKEGGLEPLRPLFGRVAKAYLIGKSSKDFAAQLGDAVSHRHCGTLDAAVQAAASDAAQSGADEPVVLLAPACASYDQFKNFEERGDRFRALVNALPHELPS